VILAEPFWGMLHEVESHLEEDGGPPHLSLPKLLDLKLVLGGLLLFHWFFFFLLEEGTLGVTFFAVADLLFELLYHHFELQEPEMLHVSALGNGARRLAGLCLQGSGQILLLEPLKSSLQLRVPSPQPLALERDPLFEDLGPAPAPQDLELLVSSF